MKTPTPHESWRNEFDLKFGEINQHYEEFFYTEKIKEFIRREKEKSALSSREEIIGVVEGLKLGAVDGPQIELPAFVRGRNSALDEVVSRLREPLHE